MVSKGSVAVQQKSLGCVDYATYTDEALHNATTMAIATYLWKKEEADSYAYEVLIPALDQIIKRYKQPGRATPYRLNGCPTVDAYFHTLGLNYSTVRSWKSRAQQRLLEAATVAGTAPEPARVIKLSPVDSPAGKVNLDELPEEARKTVMDTIGKAETTIDIPPVDESAQFAMLEPGMVVGIGKRKFTLVTIGDRQNPDEGDDGIYSLGEVIAECDCIAQLNLREIDPKPKQRSKQRKPSKRGGRRGVHTGAARTENRRRGVK